MRKAANCHIVAIMRHGAIVVEGTLDELCASLPQPEGREVTLDFAMLAATLAVLVMIAGWVYPRIAT